MLSRSVRCRTELGTASAYVPRGGLNARSHEAQERAAGEAVAVGDPLPLVSCLMPTRGRRRFVPHAIACFLQQDYPRLELVIADDGGDSVEDLVPDDARIRYVHMPRMVRIGTKRNQACAAACGDVIVHWDDDDWSATWRVSYQVRALMDTGADICGLGDILFYEPAAGRAWELRLPAKGAPLGVRRDTRLSGVVLAAQSVPRHPRRRRHALCLEPTRPVRASARTPRLLRRHDPRFQHQPEADRPSPLAPGASLRGRTRDRVGMGRYCRAMGAAV